MANNFSDATLGSLRLQSQQRSDMENNPAIGTAEWNNYISQSYKELYDLLVGAYNNDYYVAPAYQFQTTSSQSYGLPDGSPSFRSVGGTIAPKFYKLLGVDLQYSASPSGWVSLKRFEFIERNRYAYPNTTTNWLGYTNLRYRVSGDNLYVVPVPQSGQTLQVWYVPAPTPLQFVVPCGITLSSNNVTLSDTSGLSVGMQIYGTGIPTNATVVTLSSTSVTMGSVTANSTLVSTNLSFWSDATRLDGISGWEEFCVIDAAIKAQIKQENDIAPLAAQKTAIVQRIEAMAEGRDIGQAHHVSDALAMNGNWGVDDDGGGWGFGGGRGY